MKQIIPIISLILTLVITSCQNSLELNDLIDQTKPFKLTVMKGDSGIILKSKGTEEIKVNSEKWIKLIDFLKENVDGWHASPASYIGDISVAQGDFRLMQIMGSNGIVVAFKDKEGDPKQYTKEIAKGELDFLIE